MPYAISILAHILLLILVVIIRNNIYFFHFGSVFGPCCVENDDPMWRVTDAKHNFFVENYAKPNLEARILERCGPKNPNKPKPTSSLGLSPPA